MLLVLSLKICRRPENLDYLYLSVSFAQVELMGGHMTVSSKEHCGSTFTFVLPYRVSVVSDDESDDPDELPDTTSHHDTSANDDHTAGYFQFQPRTLSSSMLSLSGSTRNPDLLQSNYGYSMLSDKSPVPENINVFSPIPSTPNEFENEQTSPESSSRHSGDNAAAETSGRNDQFVGNERDIGEAQRSSNSMEVGPSASGGQGVEKLHENQEAYQTLQTCDRSLQSTASSDPEVSRAEEKPKILLVEDNKINVMVTTSMMKQLGHSIEVVNNGIEAVRAVQNRTYDLVLMVFNTQSFFVSFPSFYNHELVSIQNFLFFFFEGHVSLKIFDQKNCIFPNCQIVGCANGIVGKIGKEKVKKLLFI